ncbi:MAG TPA: aspartate aminotransferase family protein [Candidatus Sulfotelmatobacter sp.]|nr:aspartate aminotransferase family protein [Candidatus Sulfotelmatobacter sp.]
MFETEFLTSNKVSQEAYLRLISQAAQIICESMPSGPYRGLKPAELAKAIEDGCLPRQASSWEQVAQTLRTVVENSVSVTHPHTAAHLHCPPLIAALAAEVVIGALNQSMDSFDQAPIATVLEQRFVHWLCGEVGFPASADGTLTAGGSQSNYMGLLLARDAFVQKHWNWSVKKSGLPPEALRLRILCSEVAHFTVEKSSSQLGLGTDAVVRVEVDDQFRMKMSSLRSALDSLRSSGLVPMAVVATAGTTGFGSVDPLGEVASIARDAGVWLHVDAAYGGALLFSNHHRSKLDGIDAADSLTIDFHKLFWQPIPAGAFLLRDAANFGFMKMHADYLNPEAHEEEGIPNLVTTSLLTSRRFDALKLWISFQSLGREKLAAMIERTIALAAHAASVIRRTLQLELICEPQLGTIVFRYVPTAPSEADRFNARLRQVLFERGLAVIGHTRVRGQQCLKFTLMNPSVDERDIEQLIQKIVEHGRTLEGETDIQGWPAEP